ncbi:unnamed protein product [Trifolium pratense]|uniref:Uncharacterized protein n=2 Tax=Trifolium pratense TaxID=57577 RepID=A0ACB0IBI6_TRIPR|nr:unnamed protein product [Trifolium pratense]
MQRHIQRGIDMDHMHMACQLLHIMKATQGNNVIQSYIPDDSIDAKVSHQETDEAHEEDMEIGYDDRPPTPTYEGLEQRFIDEIMKLVGERSDKEDAEFARHNERIAEINEEFQEKLSSLRALQETRREEFLRKELQARSNQYQDGKRNHFPTMKVADANGYICPSTTFIAGEAASSSKFHAAPEYDKYVVEPTEHLTTTSNGIKTSQKNETRVPLPPGRVYKNSSVHN